jgi:hypothetical protein
MLDPEDGEPAYDLWDLMRDERLVRERFREFVPTEQIATSPSSDTEVFVQHYSTSTRITDTPTRTKDMQALAQQRFGLRQVNVL